MNNYTDSEDDESSSSGSYIFNSESAASDSVPYYRQRLQIREIPNKHLIRDYRFNRGKMRFISSLVKEKLKPLSTANDALSLEQRVAMCIRLLASGSFQNMVGSVHGCSKQSVSPFFTKFLEGMLQHTNKIIKLPLNDKRWLRTTSAHFERLSNKGMYGCIGALDGSNIRIKKPSQDGDAYYNRNAKPSIQMQILSGPDRLILDVNAKHPGSSHDSFIYETSGLKERLESAVAAGNFPYYTIGDKAYRNSRTVITPLKTTGTRRRRAFNKCHARSRLVVERAYGSLKGRFRIIDASGGALSYSPKKCAQIVVVCCMLHNIKYCDQFGGNQTDSSSDESSDEYSEESSSDSDDDLDGTELRNKLINAIRMH